MRHIAPSTIPNVAHHWKYTRLTVQRVNLFSVKLLKLLGNKRSTILTYQTVRRLNTKNPYHNIINAVPIRTRGLRDFIIIIICLELDEKIWEQNTKFSKTCLCTSQYKITVKIILKCKTLVIYLIIPVPNNMSEAIEVILS